MNRKRDHATIFSEQISRVSGKAYRRVSFFFSPFFIFFLFFSLSILCHFYSHTLSLLSIVVSHTRSQRAIVFHFSFVLFFFFSFPFCFVMRASASARRGAARRSEGIVTSSERDFTHVVAIASLSEQSSRIFSRRWVDRSIGRSDPW